MIEGCTRRPPVPTNALDTPITFISRRERSTSLPTLSARTTPPERHHLSAGGQYRPCLLGADRTPAPPSRWFIDEYESTYLSMAALAACSLVPCQMYLPCCTLREESIVSPQCKLGVIFVAPVVAVFEDHQLISLLHGLPNKSFNAATLPLQYAQLRRTPHP